MGHTHTEIYTVEEKYIGMHHICLWLCITVCKRPESDYTCSNIPEEAKYRDRGLLDSNATETAEEYR